METNSRVVARVAQAIKEVRQQAGLSQNDLALKLGVVQPTISGWERGENSPGLSDLSRIEKACGHPKGAIFRLAGLTEELPIEDLLLTDPRLTPELRRIAVEQYRLQVQLSFETVVGTARPPMTPTAPEAMAASTA